MSAPDFSGYFDKLFWQRLLLQATHSDDAIKHAVAAIGATHEYQLRKQASRLNSETDGLPPFALRQCNKAIKNLIIPTSKMSRYTVTIRALTASILFASFESLSGDRERAIPHIVHSRRLIEQLREAQTRNNEVQEVETFPLSLDVLEPLVAHYETQVGDFVGDAEPEGKINTFDTSETPNFDRLADARVSLERAIANLTAVCYRLQPSNDPGDIEAADVERAGYRKWFEKWDHAYARLLERESAGFDTDMLNACRLLKAHQLASSALASVPHGKGDYVWGAFTSDFKIVVKLISEIQQTMPKHVVSSQLPQTPISIAMGMTEPLYCVAARCTDPVIAKEAQALLKKLPLNEGIHSAQKVAFLEEILCIVTGRLQWEEPSSTSGMNAQSNKSFEEKMRTYQISDAPQTLDGNESIDQDDFDHYKPFHNADR